MELSITAATGFFGSQVAQERDGRDICIYRVAPGAGSISGVEFNVDGKLGQF